MERVLEKSVGLPLVSTRSQDDLYINTPSTKLASYVYLYPAPQPPATYISSTGQQQHQDGAGKETHQLRFLFLLFCAVCLAYHFGLHPFTYVFLESSRLKYVYTQYHTATQKK